LVDICYSRMACAMLAEIGIILKLKGESTCCFRPLGYHISRAAHLSTLGEGRLFRLLTRGEGSAILNKCRVNRSNFSTTKIDDSAFVLNGETYQNYGNYMELEMLEEYDISRFCIDVLMVNGLKGRIQGARRVKELGAFLNQNTQTWVSEIDNAISKSLLTGKEKEIITKARVNQSIYRKLLLKKYKTCSLCGVSENRVLIVSQKKK